MMGVAISLRASFACADAIKQNLERMRTTQRSQEMSHFQQRMLGMMTRVLGKEELKEAALNTHLLHLCIPVRKTGDE